MPKVRPVPFEQSVAEFRCLYRAVTSEILDALDRIEPHVISTQQLREWGDRLLRGERVPGPSFVLWLGSDVRASWLVALVTGFLGKYENWEVPTGPAKDETRRIVDALGDAWPTTQLCGYAYLHICFDLPVVVGERFDLYEPQGLSRGTAAETYRGLDDALMAAFENAEGLRHPRLRRLRVMRHFAYWALMLRRDAWMLAETYADLPVGARRDEFEKALCGAVANAVEEASTAKWKIWKLLPNLPAPRWLPALLVPLSSCGGAFELSGAGDSLSVVVAILALGFLFFRWLVSAFSIAQVNFLSRELRAQLAGLPLQRSNPSTGDIPTEPTEHS